MTKVIGVKYNNRGRLTYVRTDLACAKDELVVVASPKNTQLAQVVTAVRDLSDRQVPNLSTMSEVVRQANSRDIAVYQDHLQQAEDSFPRVNELIAQHGLQMKLLDIVFPLEGQQVLITFVAEQRVDFRALLKDLAKHFRARIELRQINSRQEAQVYGGLGPCGRALCCSTFLGEFPPVSIKMAKNQNLSLNSGKTTGICGRLMCCLSFEDDFYRQAKADFPDLGSSARTQQGLGTVVGIDVIAQTVKLRFEDGQPLLTYPLEEVNLDG